MRHPDQVRLALFAGGDLGFWDRWRVGRHVSQCDGCRNEVQALRTARDEIRELSAEPPADLNWNRLSEDMTGNLRVGLAAGEAIAGFDRPAVRVRPRGLGWNAAMMLAGATVVFVAAFWINLPQRQADNLWNALKRIRTERLGRIVDRPVAAGQEGAVLEASQSSIEVKENGRALSLMQHSDANGVSVSVSMKGSAGVRYVDADTGQVTINKVYSAEQ